MKMKKQFLSILLSLVMVLGIMPGMSLTAFADGTYSGGTGTEADPYLISTVDDWKALAAAVNDGEDYSGKYFRQTADLNMSGVNDLKPVGTLAKPFAGNYEGDGFAISNASISGMACSVQGYNMNVAGLFGALVEKGSISNLRVTNVSVTATSGSGGWDQAYAGGLVAFAEDCTITDCSVSGSTITAGDSNVFAGAFVGFAGAENSEKTMFSKCASENNNVNTYDYGGGFIGVIVNNTSSDDAISFTDCYSAKNAADAGTHTYGTVGGFLGGSQGGNVTVRNGFVYGCSAVATGTGSGKGVFTGDTTYGTVQATNTYYYDTNNLPANAESATAKTADEMKSLASTLGNAFSQGSDYPILLHPVNLEVSIEGWVYGETANAPSVSRNSSGTPTYTYAVRGTTDFSQTVPTEVGDYTVKATVAKTSTHKKSEATADFTISEAEAMITGSASGNNLSYTGQPQPLVTAGTVSGGTLQYALGTDANTAPTDGWSTEIPTATKPGTYYVWYRVLGDENHNGVDPACIVVTIAEPIPEETPVAAPESVSDYTLLASMKTSGDKALKLKWTAVSGAEGYDVFFGDCGGGECTLERTVTGTSCKIGKLKKGNAYKAFVKAWKTENGQKVYIGEASPDVHAVAGGKSNKYTNAKKISVKKKNLTIAVGGSKKIKASLKKFSNSRRYLNHTAKIRYYSSNRAVATVDAKGKVTGVAPGTCTVYAVAENGLRKGVKITVK